MIIVFSGTGNTAACARALAELNGREIYTLTAADLREPPSVTLDCGTDAIWMFPTYSWGIPPVVRRVMEQGAVRAANHWMITTCGDDCGDIARQWRRTMRRRGWRARNAWSVQMPNTYTMMKGFDVDAPDVARAKLAAMPGRIAAIHAAMTGPSPCDGVVRGRWAWVKTAVVYPWFTRHDMSAAGFGTTAACTGCGLCARQCPLGNIAMRDHKPVWGAFCTMCERCYHRCPTHAVEWRKATRGKGQYPGPDKV